MKKYFFILVLFIMYSCSNRYVEYFENTPAYELAKAVNSGNLNKIEKIVKKNPELLEITNDITGSNVLDLALTIENYDSFKKLLELGASSNFVNPYSKESILISACRFYEKPEPYTIDLRYIKLLLEYGADPNYVIEEDFEDDKNRYHLATSAIYEASKIDLEMVKILLKYNANPYKKLKQNQKTPFFASLLGYKNKYEITNYYIDSLKVDVKVPMYVRDNGDSLYIQDYIKKDSHDPKMLELKEKLEKMGVDFENYDYK